MHENLTATTTPRGTRTKAALIHEEGNGPTEDFHGLDVDELTPKSANRLPSGPRLARLRPQLAARDDRYTRHTTT